MHIEARVSEFGPAVACTSLEEIATFIANHPESEKVRVQAALFGLALVAAGAVGEMTYFHDTRQVLDRMAEAKARMDSAAWHGIEVARATAAVLLLVQQYVWDNTIGCTEWPMPREVANIALEEARKYVATV
jgi:hypothetical protein